jgi:hypothetical protein
MAINTPDLPIQEDSDISNPCRWFDSFVTNDKPYRYRDDFYIEAKRKYQDRIIEIDYNNDSFTYSMVVSDDGFNHPTIYHYADYLSFEIINLEKEKSISLIKKKIESCGSNEAIIFTLKVISNQLTHVINLLKKKRKLPIREFPCIPLGVYGIANYLLSAHQSFLPNPLPEIFEEAKNPQLDLFSNIIDQPIQKSKITGNSEKTEEKEKKKNIVTKSFKWKSSLKLYNIWLYDILKDVGAINEKETDIEKIEKAFSGEELTESLNIKWHLIHRNDSIKIPIFIFIDFLIDDLQILEKVETDAELGRMIQRIFVNPEGKSVEAIGVSRTNYLRMKRKHKIRHSIEVANLIQQLRITKAGNYDSKQQSG